MPKLFGLNSVGILAGSVAFYFLGFVWFGLLFQAKWAAYTGVVVDPAAEMQVLPMVFGFLNVVVVTIGLGLLLKWLNVSKLITAIKYGLIVCVCFALTTEAYWLIYAQKPMELFAINASYELIGYAMVAAIWSFFD